MLKKRQQKLRDLRKKKKTLTIFTPFELRTSKRIRVEAEQMSTKAECSYEPLWLQIQKSFKLRDTTNNHSDQYQLERSLTRPKSPTLHTNQRSKLKDDTTVNPED